MSEKLKNVPVLGLVVVAVLIFVAVVVFNDKETNNKPTEALSLFNSKLEGKVNTIDEVTVLHNRFRMKSKRRDHNWFLPDRYDYPVSLDLIRSIVVDAASMKIMEKKTNNPKRHSVLGLLNVDDENANSARIILRDSNVNLPLADFIVGNTRRSGRVSDGGSIYVRHTGRDQTWLVKGGNGLKLTPDSFLNKDVFKIAGSRIKEASFSHPLHDGFVLSRSSADRDFRLTYPDKKATDLVSLNNLATALEGGFVFEDVKPALENDFAKKVVNTAKFVTFDGLEVVVLTLTLDSGRWIKMHATALDDARKIEADSFNQVADDWVYLLTDVSGDLITTLLQDIVNK